MQLKNDYKLPETFVDVVKSLVYDPRESDSNRISITTLINNPRVRILTLKHWDEIEDDVANHIWRVLGNAVHYVLSQIEKSKEQKERLIEEKLEEKVDGFTVVGKLDLYEDKIKTVQDWKVTSVKSVQLGDHDDWESQLNCYTWLLRKCGFDVEKAQVNAIMRDWRKSEGLKYDDYPKKPITTIPIKVWSFEEQQQFIEHRLAIYKETLAMDIKDVPICSAKERWAKPDSFAVYKGSNKTASRVLETAKDAEQWAKNNLQGCKYEIRKREGTDIKCSEYCSVAPFCSYWKEKYGTKL